VLDRMWFAFNICLLDIGLLARVFDDNYVVIWRTRVYRLTIPITGSILKI
jgi:hypothetical protein